MDTVRKSAGSEQLYCPECGAPLYPGKAKAHAEDHWPDATPSNRMSPEAVRRRDLTRAGGVRKGES